MYKQDAGYIVTCRGGQEYFENAVAALEYADFWEASGYDSLIWKVQVDDDEECVHLLRQEKSELWKIRYETEEGWYLDLSANGDICWYNDITGEEGECWQSREEAEGRFV